MNMIAINPQRIKYMLKLYGLELEDFIALISKGLVKPYIHEDIFSDEIKLSVLKKVDKLFQKGLSFYTSPTVLTEQKNHSIFFRKQNFNSELELGDREIVNKVEDKIQSLSALEKLSDFKISRKLPLFKITDKPREAATSVYAQVIPQEVYSKSRDFLQAFIYRLADNNIIVNEFVETWNKKNKTNLNGFFIQPNTITIKRNQKALKKEIFTLAHELGHYLINVEEIDRIEFSQDRDDIERWCDEFAFYLLAHSHIEAIKTLNTTDLTYNNQDIKRISNTSHISRLAIFTHLATTKKITWSGYNIIKGGLEKEYKQLQIELQKIKNNNKGINSGGRAPKAIISPLEKDIYVNAYFEGVMKEHEVLAKLKENNIDKLIYGYR